MNIDIKIPEKFDIDNFTLQKMIFLYNTLESGWTIKKNNQQDVFSKKHEQKHEVYLESYLKDFLNKHITIQNNLKN